MALRAGLATVEPAQAQTQTQTVIWSGTMTIGEETINLDGDDYDLVGYSDGYRGLSDTEKVDLGGLSSPSFIRDHFTDHAIIAIISEAGDRDFTLITKPALGRGATHDWQLHVGSQTYNFKDASAYSHVHKTDTRPQSSTYWFEPPTTWSTAYDDGDTIALRITRALNTYPKHVPNARTQPAGGSSQALQVSWDQPRERPGEVTQYEIQFAGGSAGRTLMWRCVEDIDDPTVITKPKDTVAGTAPNANEACFEDRTAIGPERLARRRQSPSPVRLWAPRRLRGCQRRRPAPA